MLDRIFKVWNVGEYIKVCLCFLFYKRMDGLLTGFFYKR